MQSLKGHDVLKQLKKLSPNEAQRAKQGKAGSVLEGCAGLMVEVYTKMSGSIPKVARAHGSHRTRNHTI